MSCKALSLDTLRNLQQELSSCSSSIFIENCLPWSRSLLQLFQREASNSSTNDRALWARACDCFSQLSKYASCIPQLSRSLVTEKILDEVINCHISSPLDSHSLSLLDALFEHFPGPAGLLAGKFEKKVLSRMEWEIGDEDVIMLAARSIARLSFVGQVARRDERWHDFQQKVLGSLVESGKELQTVLGVCSTIDELMVSKKFHVKEVRIEDEATLRIVCQQFRFSLACLQSVFSNGTRNPVEFRWRDFVNFLLAFLTIHCFRDLNKCSPEKARVVRALLSLQERVLQTITLLTDVLGADMAVHGAAVLARVGEHLNGTLVKQRTAHCDIPNLAHRLQVYDCLLAVLVENGPLLIGELREKFRQFLNHLLSDIAVVQTDPLTTTGSAVKIVINPVVSSGRKKHRGKKHRGQSDTLGALFTEQQKVDPDAHVQLTTKALEVLGAWSLWFDEMANTAGNRSSRGLDASDQRLQFAVEQLLERLCGRDEFPPPYQHSQVLCQLIRFLSAYHIYASANLIGLCCGFLRICANHRSDNDVRALARHSLVVVETCVIASTPSTDRAEIRRFGTRRFDEAVDMEEGESDSDRSNEIDDSSAIDSHQIPINGGHSAAKTLPKEIQPVSSSIRERRAGPQNDTDSGGVWLANEPPTKKTKVAAPDLTAVPVVCEPSVTEQDAAPSKTGSALQYVPPFTETSKTASSTTPQPNESDSHSVPLLEEMLASFVYND